MFSHGLWLMLMSAQLTFPQGGVCELHISRSGLKMLNFIDAVGKLQTDSDVRFY